MQLKIPDILKKLGLAKYQALFEQHAIEDALLPELTANDLREIGIVPLGHRKQILSAIRELSGRNDVPVGPGEIQHRQIAVLFADLADSTRLSQALESEQLRELTRAYQAIAKDAIERYGGHVAQYLGDGILAYFGYPHAHEDDTERSVRAALDLLAGLNEMQAHYAERLGVDVNARIGVETGQVIVGGHPEQDQAAIGETPNLAARLQSEAANNTVVVGPGAKRLLANHVQTRSLGSRRPKGFDRDIKIWEVFGVGFGLDRIEDRSRSVGPAFVGRDDELAEIEAALSITRKGEPATMHVVGEPGIGKSRLIYEFRKRAPKSVRVLEASCPNFGASALHPFAQILRSRGGGNNARAAEVLSEDIRRVDTALDRELPYLLRLCGLETKDTEFDAETIATKTHNALLHWIAATGKIVPTTLFVNNLHWIDERSEAVLHDLVTSQLRGVFILCTYRPDYSPPWTNNPSVRTLRLGPLSEEACNALYREFGGPSSKTGLQIAEKSGGNPLFIEELARHDQIHADQENTDRSAVPSSLAGLLMQRVDRLSPKAKEFLRTASVAGRFFSPDLIMQKGGQRDLAVSELIRSGLLLETPAGDRVEFKHALVQDAVYESLLNADRKHLHAKIAHRLEDRFYDREKEVAEQLSRHYEIAGEALAAAKYAFHAGEKALELFALRDAAFWFEKCLELYPEELDTDDALVRAQAVNHQMQVYCWDARFDEMLALGGQELDRMRKLDKNDELSRMLAWLGEAYLHNWRYQDAASTLSDALQIAELSGDQGCIGHVLAEMAWLETITGDPSRRKHFEKIVDQLTAIAEREKDRLFATFARYARWSYAAHEGRIRDMRHWAEDLISIGDDTGYPPALSWGHCMLAYTDASSGNLKEALHSCRIARETAECAFDRLASDLCKALCLQEHGDAEGANAVLERVGRPVSDVGSFYFGYASNIARANSMAKLGRLDAAKSLLNRLIDRYGEAGNHRACAMALAALGEVLLEVDPGQADKLLSKATNLAEQFLMRGLQAKVLARRGALARLAGEERRSQMFFEESARCAEPLGWLALEQQINAMRAGLLH